MEKTESIFSECQGRGVQYLCVIDENPCKGLYVVLLVVVGCHSTCRSIGRFIRRKASGMRVVEN